MITRKLRVITSMDRKKVPGSTGSIMVSKVVRGLFLKIIGQGCGYSTMKMGQFIKNLHMRMVF